MMATQGSRPARAVRSRNAARGIYERHDGTPITVRQMSDPHVVNALLRELEEGGPPRVVRALAEEVARRRLRAYAEAVVRERRQR